MSNTYTWAIENLEYSLFSEGQSNVVNKVHWRLLGTDGTYTGQVYGVQPMIYDLESSFIPYTNLTEDIVIGWVQNSLGAEQIYQLKLSINSQITTQANPTTSNGLPW